MKRVLSIRKRHTIVIPVTNTSSAPRFAALRPLMIAALLFAAAPPASALAARSANVGLTMSGPSSVAPGSNVVYTITVANSGPNNATQVRVSNPTPAGLVFVSNSGACTTAFPCALGSLARNATRTITATFQVPAGYTSPNPILNHATVTARVADPVEANNSASVSTSLVSADLALTASTPSVAVPGADLTMSVTVTNLGPSSAGSVRVDAPSPSGLVFVSNAGDCATGFPCELGNLAMGATRTITSTYSVPSAYRTPDPIVRTATVSGAVLDEHASNNLVSSSISVTPSADLEVAGVAPATIVPGTDAVYRFTVTNRGPSVAEGVVLANPTPSGLVFEANDGDCTGEFPCVFGSLAVGESRTVQTTLAVPSSYSGPDPVVALALVSASNADPAGANDTASLSSPVGARADLEIEAAAPGGVTPGTTFVQTVTVTNHGPSDAADVSVANPTPTGLAFVSNSGACPGAYPCALGVLPAGQSRTIATTWSVPANYTTPAPVVVTATTSASTTDPVAANNTSSSSSEISSIDSDLEVSLSGPAVVTPGTNAVYIAVVTNHGPSAAALTSVTNTTPSGLSFVSNSGAGAGAFPCALGTLDAGASRTITTTYAVPASYTTPNPVVNTVRASSSAADSVPANDVASATSSVQARANLSISRSAPASVQAGELLTVTVVVANAGPSDARNVSVAAPTPPGLAFVSNSGACVGAYPCSLATVAAGGTRTITTTYRVPSSFAAPASVSGTATVSSTTADPETSNNSSSSSTSVSARADLAIVATGAASVAAGNTVVYTTTVTNLGPSDASAVQVSAPTPADLVFVSNSGDCTSAFPCALGVVAAGATRTVQTTFAVPASYTTPSSIAFATLVATSTEDAASGNNASEVSTTVSRSADLSVHQSAPGGVTPGTQLVVTVAVANQGPSDAAAVVVTSPTPTGLVFVSNSGACSGAYPCSLGTLASGTTRTITTTFSVPSNYSTPDPITSSVSVSSSTPDPSSANNSGSVSIDVTSDVSELAIAAVGPTSVTPGTVATYTLTVSNQGPSDATGADVEAIVPAGFVFVSNTGACTGAFPCTLTNVPNGSSRTITSTWTVPAAYTSPAPAVSTFLVSAFDADPVSSNNSASVSSAVTPSSDLAVSQSAPADVTPGQTLVYTRIVANAGVSEAGDVVVDAPTPLGLQFVSNAGACATSFPCSLGRLAVGATRTIASTYLVPEHYRTPDPIVATVSVHGSGTDPVSSNDSAGSSTTVRSVCGDGVVGAGEQCDGEACCDATTCRFRSAGQVCRAAAGDCDVAETCTGAAAECPADAFAPSDVVCRAVDGDCDAAETCSGASADCPADAFAEAGLVCRSGSGDSCDPDEICSGNDAACPADIVAEAGTPCREAGGVCDTAETCTGIAVQACPVDAFADSHVVCRAAAGACDIAETCTGTTAECPADAFAEATMVCRPGSGDVCDPDEYCDGASAACPEDVVAEAGTTCREADGACDAAETCTGLAGQACPVDAFADSNVVCRAAAGACDIAETCTGASAECPADTLADATVVCREAGGQCDSAESCDGASAECPADAFAPLGTACAADGNECTDDVCDGQGACGVNNTAPCDDASVCTENDRCSAGTCTGEALDCSDGDVCSHDTCDPDLGCVSSYEPEPDCFRATKAKLVLRDAENDSKDALLFMMKTEEAVTMDRLGDPFSGADYGLCVYDVSSGPEDSFIGSAVVPAGRSWSMKDRVLRYFDKTASVEGVREIRTAATRGERPSTKQRFIAKGRRLVLPGSTGSGDHYFSSNSRLVVQMANGQGACWSAAFSGSSFLKNSPGMVKARSR
jgi:uncharacterized repeat protein (TIGR01451 family)